jgi:hypothetical protein
MSLWGMVRLLLARLRQSSLVLQRTPRFQVKKNQHTDHKHNQLSRKMVIVSVEKPTPN